MKARSSLKFGQIRLPTAELAALERLKTSPYTYNGESVLPLFLRCFNRIIFILTGNDDIHKSLEKVQNSTRSDHGLQS